MRKQQELAQKKLHDKRRREQGLTHEEYERRLQDEIERRLAKEKELEKLASLEMELIERLRKKQSEQYRAYNELEGVLGVPSAPRRSTSAQSLRGSPSHQHQVRGGAAAERSVQQVRAVDSASVVPGAPSASEPAPGEPSDEEIARAFSKFDTEGTGVIGRSTIGDLMADLGSPLNDVQLAQAVSQLDPNETGKVDFGSFLYWYHG